jgi:hypothetical protein
LKPRSKKRYRNKLQSRRSTREERLLERLRKAIAETNDVDGPQLDADTWHFANQKKWDFKRFSRAIDFYSMI